MEQRRKCDEEYKNGALLSINSLSFMGTGSLYDSRRLHSFCYKVFISENLSVPTDHNLRIHESAPITGADS